MDLAERHTRIRAHDDEQARIDMHSLVVRHFGGEYRRAVWFMNELSIMNDIAYEPATPKFYSIQHGYVNYRKED